MKKIIIKKFHRNALIGLMLGAALLAYILFVIYPDGKTRVSLDREINDLSARIEEHKLLAQIFKDLVKSLQLEVPEELSFPEVKQLAQNDTDRIPIVFRQIAQNSNLKLEGFRLDVKSFVNDSGFLQTDVLTKGSYIDFRNFLKNICELPFVENIDRINVRAVQDSEELEFRLYISLTRG